MHFGNYNILIFYRSDKNENCAWIQFVELTNHPCGALDGYARRIGSGKGGLYFKK